MSKTFAVNVTIHIKADTATEAVDSLGAELDDLLEGDSGVVGVSYPYASDVKEESHE